MYLWALEHWHKYGECPTMVTAKDNFPMMQNLIVEDTVEYLLDQMVASRQRDATVEMLQDAMALVDGDNDDVSARALLRSQLATIEDEGGLAHHNDVDVTKTTQERLAAYQELRHISGGLLGYATGFATIDMATNGLQCGQLVTVVAQPKAGKSTLMLLLAKYIHLTAGVPVMVVSFEMTNHEQEMRLDAMIGGVSSQRLRTGRLQLDEEVRLKRKLKEFSRREEFWLTSDAAGATVSGIAAKIEKYKPAVVLVDGVYLMQDELGEDDERKKLTNITRNMKRLALRTNLPIVISTQALTWKMNKKKLSADSIGYSSSFFQDSDVILGLEHVAGDDGEPDDLQRRLKVVASRNSPNVGVKLLWDWETSTFVENGEYDMDAA